MNDKKLDTIIEILKIQTAMLEAIAKNEVAFNPGHFFATPVKFFRQCMEQVTKVASSCQQPEKQGEALYMKHHTGLNMFRCDICNSSDVCQVSCGVNHTEMLKCNSCENLWLVNGEEFRNYISAHRIATSYPLSEDYRDWNDFLKL